MKIDFKNRIDIDKLQAFIVWWYGTLRNFSYHLWYNYQSFHHTLHSNWWKKFNPKFYRKIIEKLNEWVTLEWYTMKPIKKIEEVKFYKKS